MEVIRLNQQLFNSNKFNKNEIEDNKNGKRPYFYSFKRMTACHAIHLPLFSQITKMGDALFSYSTVCSTEKYLFCAISHFIYCI